MIKPRYIFAAIAVNAAIFAAAQYCRPACLALLLAPVILAAVVRR